MIENPTDWDKHTQENISPFITGKYTKLFKLEIKLLFLNLIVPIKCIQDGQLLVPLSRNKVNIVT